MSVDKNVTGTLTDHHGRLDCPMFLPIRSYETVYGNESTICDGAGPNWLDQTK